MCCTYELNSANFIKAFFAFTDEIHKRESHYVSNYGLLPYFKAGVHYGPIVVSEVGDIKREISYHGDTINTASRIQGMCNQFNSQLLVSDLVFQSLKETSQWSLLEAGNVQLKGKLKEVKLYKVERLVDL